MKNSKRNLLVNSTFIALVAVFSVGACSSKDTVQTDNTPVTSSPATTTAATTPDTSNLGSASSGRGR